MTGRWQTVLVVTFAAAAGCAQPTRAEPAAAQTTIAPDVPRASAGRDSSGSIHGTVVRGRHDLPDAARTVTLVQGGAPRTTGTDPWGGFAFDGIVPETPAELRVEAPGCADVHLAAIVLVAGERRDVGELPLDTPGTLDVRVADERGAPLPGATVAIFRRPGGPLAEYVERASCAWDAVPDETSVTDAKGRAEFLVPAASWTVAASAPGCTRVAVPRQWSEARKTNEIALQLSKAEPLSGRVLDAQGRPVPSARVAARPHVPQIGMCGTCDPPHDGSALWQHADADARGRFVLDALPPGVIEMLAAAPGEALAYAGSVDNRSLHDVDLTLAPTGAMRGRATDAATGAPVAGVVVVAKAGHMVETAQIAVTGADGRYVLGGIPAGHEVGFGASAPDGWTSTRPAATPRRASERLGADQTVTRDVSVERAATVTGRALRDGVPVSGASVHVTTLPEDLDGTVPGTADGRTDAAGRFRIDGVLPGRIALFASAPGDDRRAGWDVFVKNILRSVEGRGRQAFDLAAGAVGEHDVSIEAAPSDAETRAAIEQSMRDSRASSGHVRVFGRITTADGVPVLGATFDVDSYGLSRGEDMRFPRPAAPDGSYEWVGYAGRDQHTLTVLAQDERHALARVEDVEVPSGAREVEVNVVLPAPAALRGRVVAAGRPVAGATVLAGGVAIAQSGADGTFEARGAFANETLAVQARGFVRREFDKAGAEFVLDPAQTISGRVVDASGAPVAGLSVTPLGAKGSPLPPYGRWRHSNPPAAGVTDADGRFRLDEVPTGSWRLRVEATKGSLGPIATFATAPVAAGSTDVRLLTTAARTIDGRVFGPGGSPVAHAKVHCRPGPAGEVRATSYTDKQGRFEFTNLADRSYWIYVEPDTPLVPERRLVKAGTTDLVIKVVKAPSISGVVLTRDGEPFTAAQVEAIRVDPQDEDVVMWPWGLRDSPDGKSGAFEIVVPPGSRFRLELGYGGRDWTVRGGEDVTAGQTDIRLVAEPRPGK